MSAPFDKIVVIDYETRYSSKPQSWCPDAYTLRRLTTEEYVRSPLFQDFGASLKEFRPGATVAQWYRPQELKRILAMYDWSRTAVVAHNAQFDVSIMSWHYGIQPAFIFDTLSMSRALRGARGRNGLKDLAKDFGLPDKGEEIALSDGLWELPWEVEKKLASYCNHDVFLCEEILKRFLMMQERGRPEDSEINWDAVYNPYDMRNWRYPIKELRLIDMTLRMYTRPLLQLDQKMLGNALEEERETREKLLGRLGITDADLQSNDRFAEILRSIGVEPPLKRKNPTKTNPKGEGYNFAFAKNDAGFQALMASSDDNVVTLCEARLKVKSTTERTRAQRFLDISTRGTLPVPLHYYGAASGRWAAAKGSAINMQNMKRGSFLRKSIMAPEGHVIVVGDLSQIEPRVLAWLSDYDELLDIFRSGKDAYAQFGAQMFNIPGMTKDTNPVERQSAKSALLGAGFGLGWASFAAQLLVGFLGAPPKMYTKQEARQLGVNGAYIERFLDWDENLKQFNEIPHNCTKQELLIHCVTAKKIIDIYRATAHPVVAFWEMCSDLIQRSLLDGEEYNHKGVLLFRKEELVLPSGMSVRYPNLRIEKDERGRPQYVFGENEKLYSGRLTNHCVQGTARVVMSDGMLRVAQKMPVVAVVHDEIVAVAPEADGEKALGWMIRRMTEEPKYMPGIPLAADGGVHRRYGLAKN